VELFNNKGDFLNYTVVGNKNLIILLVIIFCPPTQSCGREN